MKVGTNMKFGLDLQMKNISPASRTLTQGNVDAAVGENLNYMHLQETHTYTNHSSIPSVEKREPDKGLLQAEQEESDG